MAYSTTPSAPAAGSTITADGTAIIAGLVGNEAGFVLEAFDTAGNVVTRTSALNPFGTASAPGGPGTFAGLTDAPTANPALAAILAQYAAATDAQKQRIDALLAGADGSVDTFIEAFNRFVADENVAAALTGQISNLQQVQATHTTQIAANATAIQQNATWIGSMSSLLSSAKDTLVNAYNELFNKVTLNTSNIASLFAAQPVAGLGLAQTGNVFSLTLDAPLTALPAGTAGGLISNTDGTVLTGNATQNAYTYSDFLPLTPGVNVIFNFFPQYSAFYDANKVYISGIPRSGVAPANAAFMRVSSDTDGTGAPGAQLSHVLYSSLRANLGGLPYVRGLVNQGTLLYPNAKGFVDVAAFASGSSGSTTTGPTYSAGAGIDITNGAISTKAALLATAAEFYGTYGNPLNGAGGFQCPDGDNWYWVPLAVQTDAGSQWNSANNCCDVKIAGLYIVEVYAAPGNASGNAVGHDFYGGFSVDQKTNQGTGGWLTVYGSTRTPINVCRTAHLQVGQQVGCVTRQLDVQHQVIYNMKLTLLRPD